MDIWNCELTIANHIPATNQDIKFSILNGNGYISQNQLGTVEHYRFFFTNDFDCLIAYLDQQPTSINRRHITTCF